ncbi:hypothetical protein Tco_0041708 [Tanacetum coccineum]
MLEAQVKELVFHQGFPISQQIPPKPQVKELKLRVTILRKKRLIKKKLNRCLLNEEEEHQDDQDDDDDRSIDIEETDDDEKTNDEFVHDDEYVHDDDYVHNDVDEEMKDAKVAVTRKDNEEITDAEKTEATKGDHEKARKLPPKSSSLSISSGFGNQFINLSSDISLISTIKDSA